MSLMEAVSLRIRELLKERKLNQYQLFKNTGVPQSTISTIMSEKDRTCKLLTVQSAEGFGMGLKEFFDSEIFSFHIIDVE